MNRPGTYRADGSACAEMPDQDSGKDIFLLLLQANVLRLRGQYDLAEAQCSEVLRREPANAEAHSILGDIARDRGDDQDAIQWYKMALDLDPGNMTDRKKLEAAIDRVYSRDSVLHRLRSNVSDTLGSTAEEIRSAKLPSAMSITLAIVVAIILIVAISVLVLGRGGAVIPQPAAAEPAPGGFVVPSDTALAPKPLERSATAGEAAAEPRFTGEVAPIEVAMLEALRREARILDPNCTVEDAGIDPQDGLVSVVMSMPRLLSREHTRASILRVAAPLAVVAARSDARVAMVRVRCDARERDHAGQLAFTAETHAEDLSQLSDDRADWTPETVFSTIWWDAKLRPEMESVPPPGVR